MTGIYVMNTLQFQRHRLNQNRQFMGLGEVKVRFNFIKFDINVLFSQKHSHVLQETIQNALNRRTEAEDSSINGN